MPGIADRGLALADQAVYKCGQEITNQPNDPSQCQKLLISNPTQIEGTRVQNGQSPKPVSAVSGPAVERISITPNQAQDALERNALEAAAHLPCMRGSSHDASLSL